MLPYRIDTRRQPASRDWGGRRQFTDPGRNRLLLTLLAVGLVLVVFLLLRG